MNPLSFLFPQQQRQRGGALSNMLGFGYGGHPGMGGFQGMQSTGTMGTAPAGGRQGQNTSDTLMSGYSGPTGLSRFRNGGQTVGGTMQMSPYGR